MYCISVSAPKSNKKNFLKLCTFNNLCLLLTVGNIGLIGLQIDHINRSSFLLPNQSIRKTSITGAGNFTWHSLALILIDS